MRDRCSSSSTSQSSRRLSSAATVGARRSQPVEAAVVHLLGVHRHVVHGQQPAAGRDARTKRRLSRGVREAHQGCQRAQDPDPASADARWRSPYLCVSSTGSADAGLGADPVRCFRPLGQVGPQRAAVAGVVEELGGEHLPVAQQREPRDGQGPTEQRAGDVDSVRAQQRREQRRPEAAGRVQAGPGVARPATPGRRSPATGPARSTGRYGRCWSSAAAPRPGRRSSRPPRAWPPDASDLAPARWPPGAPLAPHRPRAR